MNFAFLQDFAPIGVLILGAFALALLDLWPRWRSIPQASRWLTLAALLLAFAASIGFWHSSLGPNPPDVEHGSFVIDRFALFFYAVALATTGAVVACGADAEAELDPHRSVYHLLLLISTSGVLCTASAADVTSLGAGLALTLLPLGLCQSLRKTHLPSLRAALRGLSVNGFSLLAMVSGMALLAGMAGSTSLARIPQGLSQLGPLVVVAASLLLLGAALQLGVFPFSWWRSQQAQRLPQGPHLAATLIGWVAATAALLRLLPGTLGAAPAAWSGAAAGLAAATLVVAPLLAVRQRRLLGAVVCLLPTQLALGLASLPEISPRGEASVLYLLLCTIPLGAALLGWIASVAAQGQGDGIADLRGLWGRSPLLAVALGLLLWGLAGLPPSAGFFVRLLTVSSTMEAGLGWLVWVELLSALVSTLVVFRWLLRILDARVDGVELELPGGSARAGIILCGAAVLGFGALLGPLFAIAARAALAPLVGP